MDEPADLHIESLRRLARGLLHDRHRAEDIVQEAWLAALRRRPEPRDLGAWLAGAVRRLARGTAREEQRRGARERRAARGEALPSAAELGARIEILRRMLDAVEALDEPYRTAIGLRFLDDLPPREIARRLGVPVETVRTRVRRGLERLRRELDPGDGRGRESFLSALAPLAGPAPWAASALGAGAILDIAVPFLVMKKKIVIAGLAVALLGITAGILGRGGPAPQGPETLAVALAAPEPAVDAPEPETPPAAEPAEHAEPAQEARAPAAPARDWVVRGHVMRDASSPYPGARLVGRVVDLSGPERVPLLEEPFLADEHGELAWALEAPDRKVEVRIEADMQGHATQGWWGSFLPGDPAPSGWRIGAFPLDCTLRATVRDPEGQPVPAAGVLQGGYGLEARTDAAGRFELSVPSLPGDLWLNVVAEGFAQLSLPVGALEPGERSLPDLVLSPELRVRGRVLDEQGNPIDGAEVRASTARYELRTATTDEAGAFELSGLDPAPGRAVLVATRPGFVRTLLRLTEEHAAGSELELRMPRAVAISGWVLSPEREPVAGATVSLDGRSSGDRAGGRWTLSDGEGRFELGGAGAGPQQLWVRRRGFVHAPHAVEIPYGLDRLERVELVLERGAFLGGVVLDEDDEPLPFAQVFLERVADVGGMSPRPAVNARRDGRFRFEDLPRTRLRVVVLAGDRARYEHALDELDRDDLVLRPPRSAALAGRVLDAESGAPLRSFVVRVENAPPSARGARHVMLPSSWRQGIAFLEAPEGTWRLAYDFPAGELLRVEVRAEGYAPATADAVLTAIDPDPDAFVVRLARRTRIHGQVLDARDGAALAGARVRSFRDASELHRLDRPPPETRTDAAGRFELTDVPTGETRLAVEHPGRALAVDGPFEVSGAAPVERRIALGSGARIRGRLLDGAREGIADETVSAIGIEVVGEASEWEATTAADGSYELSALPEGTYHVSWAQSRARARANDLLTLVRLGEDEELELDLAPKGRATVRGRIDFDGTLPELVAVRIQPEHLPEPDDDPQAMRWARSSRATFAEHGRFELHGLEGGRHVARVYFELPGTKPTVPYMLHGAASGSSGPFDVPETGIVDIVIPVRAQR